MRSGGQSQRADSYIVTFRSLISLLAEIRPQSGCRYTFLANQDISKDFKGKTAVKGIQFCKNSSRNRDEDLPCNLVIEGLPSLCSYPNINCESSKLKRIFCPPQIPNSTAQWPHFGDRDRLDSEIAEWERRRARLVCSTCSLPLSLLPPLPLLLLRATPGR